MNFTSTISFYLFSRKRVTINSKTVTKHSLKPSEGVLQSLSVLLPFSLADDRQTDIHIDNFLCYVDISTLYIDVFKFFTNFSISDW